MPIVQLGNLVALPFNAAASRKQQHKDCPTFVPSRDDLWQQTLGMMHEEYDNWTSHGRSSSYYHFLRGRFVLDDWPLEKIATNRNDFLAFETHNEIAVTVGKRTNYGFLIVDAQSGRVLGERRTGHLDSDPHTATGIDTVRPSARGKGLSYAFFELGCLLAKEMGYVSYRAGIAGNLPASYKRLERMVSEGRAERLPGDWDNNKHYQIDLKNFTPATISARCG